MCFNSSLARSFTTEDPANTYSDLFTITVPSESVLSNTSSMDILLTHTAGADRYLRRRFTLTVIPSSFKAYVVYSGSTSREWDFTFSDWLSSAIPVSNSLSLYLSGRLPSSSFTVTVESVRKTDYSIMGVNSMIHLPSGYVWDTNELRELYLSGNAVDRLAAVCFNKLRKNT